MGKWIFYFVIITWLFPLVSLASVVKFDASAPKIVQIGEQFSLTYSMNVNPSQFQPPKMEGFRVLSGPNQSRSTSVQYVNGQMTRSVNVTYIYYMEGLKEGHLTIQPATIMVNGKSYQSNSLEIEVVAGAAQQKTSESKQHKQQKQPKEDLFIRVLLSKRKVYQGEPLVATVKIYNKLNLVGFEGFQPPEFNGFAKQNIEVPQLTSLERENIGGEIYGTGILQQYLLIPQRSGELLIDPVEVTCRVRESVARSFWNSFRERRVPLKSAPAKVEVKSLPGNRPATFSGGVGKFTAKAEVDKREVGLNEPINLKVTVSGSGNLRYLRLPEIQFPTDFEVYDPDIKNAFRNSASGQAGNKVYEYLIIPRHSGNFIIPSIPLTYFDLEEERYVTKETDPIEITVFPGKGKAEEEYLVSGFESRDLRYLGEDVRFIKTEKITRKKNLFFLIDQWYYWGIYILFSGLLIAYVFHLNKLKKEAGNRIVARNKKANKQVKRRLKKVRKYMQDHNESLFHEEMIKALWGYMSDRLMIPLSDLSKEKVESVLSHKQVENELIRKYFDLIDACEFARYAPGQDEKQDDMEGLYTRAVDIISHYENKI